MPMKKKTWLMLYMIYLKIDGRKEKPAEYMEYHYPLSHAASKALKACRAATILTGLFPNNKKKNKKTKKNTKKHKKTTQHKNKTKPKNKNTKKPQTTPKHKADIGFPGL